MPDLYDTITATKENPMTKPITSDPIKTMFGPVAVTARPMREGHQLAPEVTIRDTAVDILHVSPDQARALADALREAADQAEQ